MTAREGDGVTAFWPFLICRGRLSGFRVVAAPDFLCTAELAGLLWDVAGGAPMGPGEGRHRLVTGAAVGDFVVMFTVRLAEGADVGEDGVRPRDQHSRPIPVVEGVVERASRFRPVGADVLQRGRAASAGPLRDFWRADRAWPGTLPTGSFTAGRAGEVPLRWQELEPRAVPERKAGGAERKAGGREGSAARGTPPTPRSEPKPEHRSTPGPGPRPGQPDTRRRQALLGGAGLAAVAAVIAWVVESKK